MHTLDILSHLVENHLLLTYLLIFAITIFEGEIVAISSGILVLLGVLNFWFALIVIFAGGMMKTFIGYALGKMLHKKFNNHRMFQYIERRVLSIMPNFKAQPFWSIFISKFIMMNHVVIIFAGYKKVDYKKYLKAEISSTLLWAPGLILLGYFFSYTAIRLSDEIWQFALIVVVLTILFILFDKLVKWIYGLFEEFYYGSSQ